MHILLVSETLITPDQSLPSGEESGRRVGRMMQVLPFICLRDSSKEIRTLQPGCHVLMSSSSERERDRRENSETDTGKVSIQLTLKESVAKKPKSNKKSVTVK